MNVALEVAGKAPVAADPGKGALDDPALRQHFEAWHVVNFTVSSRQVPVPDGSPTPKVIAGLGETFEEEHERSYGHRFPGEKAVQTISLRLTGSVVPAGRRTVDAKAMLRRAGKADEEGRRMAYFGPAAGGMASSPARTHWVPRRSTRRA